MFGCVAIWVVWLGYLVWGSRFVSVLFWLVLCLWFGCFGLGFVAVRLFVGFSWWFVALGLMYALVWVLRIVMLFGLD